MLGSETMPNHYLEWTDDDGQAHRLEVIDKVFIGRACQGIEEGKRIILKHREVSRDHAIISSTGSHLQITDMSRNGVWVNDARMAPGSVQELHDKDILGVGKARILVQCPDSVRSENNTASFKESLESTQAGPVDLFATSLVADVRGFSGMSQRQDSSYIYALMKTVFEKLAEVVRDYKGTVMDYVGDAIYAFWDHGFAPRNEPAILACKAALKQLQIVNAMPIPDGARDSKGIRMGWGITTGKVTMAHYSARVADLALVGDCTNLAFRFSDMANKDLPSPIVVCSRTADLVRDRLAMSELGFVHVRGRTGKEQIFGLN